MPKKYMVELAQDERDELEAVLKSSTDSAGRGSGGRWPCNWTHLTREGVMFTISACNWVRDILARLRWLGSRRSRGIRRRLGDSGVPGSGDLRA